MALGPSPAPAPSGIGDIDEFYYRCTKDYTITLEALVILAAVAMFLLHVLGSLCRQSSHGLLHGVVTRVDMLCYPLVSYTIGRMNKSTVWYYNDFAVWAVFLLLLLGSADSLTACRLVDIDNWKGIYIKHVLKGFFVVSIVVEMYMEDKWMRDKMKKEGLDGSDGGMLHSLWWPLGALLSVGILKGYVRIASMRMVSKPYLYKNVRVIADYMRLEENLVELPFDPVTMQGYRYIVASEKYWCREDGLKKKKKATTSLFWRHPNPNINKVTTVEEIWQCNGNLLLDGKRGKLLKDLSLSMALSKMISRRFVGFKLSEAKLEKTHDLVFKGLLTSGDKPHQRVFRVIEEELVFVHGLYYTRYSYLYKKGRYLGLCLPVIMCGLCLWLTITCLRMNKTVFHELKDKVKDQPQDTSVVGVTIFTTVVLSFLEAYQLYLYISSTWFKVALIQSYVSTPSLQRSGSCLEMIIGLLLRLKSFHPWKDALGQYCLLRELGRNSRSRNFLHYATLRLVDKAKKKARKSSVKLSENVKKAIVDSLLVSNGNLTNGVTSLQKNGVHGKFSSWACDDAGATDGKVTRTILVWHIATTICQQRDAQSKEEDAATIASTLSQYCMHLLAFAPNLLPDHSSISELILEQAIDEADKLLIKEHKDLYQRCRILKEYSGDDAPLLTQGAQLASHLMNDIQDSTLRWKVLSDFWAEMMLYVSPSDDAQAHLEVLAKGGEFITHIWALLTHAGVLKRGHTELKDV